MIPRRPQTAHCLLVLSSILALGLVHAGCGDGGDGGGASIGIPPTVGNAAIDATLLDLEDSLLDKDPNLDGAITVGTIANPNASLPDVVNQRVTLDPGTYPQDGTTTAVLLDVIVPAPNSDGSHQVTVTIDDEATGHEFFTAIVLYDAPLIQFRAPPLGLANLAVDGTGQAFIVASIDYTGSITRAYAGTTPTAATLVDFSGLTSVPDGIRDGVFTAYEEYLIEYRIVLSGSALQARIVAVHPGSRGAYFARTNGPPVGGITHNFTTLRIDSTNLSTNRDVEVPLGTDADPFSTFTATSAAQVDVLLGGGVTGGDWETDITGVLNPAHTTDTDSLVNYTGNLAATAADVDDGTIQADEGLRVESRSREDASGGAVVHSLDDLIAPFESLVDLLYLRTRSDQQSALFLYR
jgi:hypothetical protein